MYRKNACIIHAKISPHFLEQAFLRRGYRCEKILKLNSSIQRLPLLSFTIHRLQQAVDIICSHVPYQSDSHQPQRLKK